MTFHVHSLSRVLSLMAACVVVVVALLGFSGAADSTAHADSPDADADAKFLAALDSQGIMYASPEVMIAAGHTVCTELDRGETPARVARDVMHNKDVLTGSNLAPHHAGFFVGASISAYCPTYAGRI